MRRSAAPAIPAPIPAFAPVLRPEGAGENEGILLADDVEVGLKVDVADALVPVIELEAVLAIVAREGACEVLAVYFAKHG